MRLSVCACTCVLRKFEVCSCTCMCFCACTIWGNGAGRDDKWCVHARVMIVYSNIHSKLNAQVKGAAKKMVTVVATRELEAGDVLRRFKAETDQDEPRRGNNNNRYVLR